MAHQMAHEDALWLGSVIRLGPQWHKGLVLLIAASSSYWKLVATKHINVLHVVRQSWMVLLIINWLN